MSVVRLPGVLTVPEAAAQVAVSAGTLRNEIKRGIFVPAELVGCVRILDEDLAAVVESDQPPPNDDVIARAGVEDVIGGCTPRTTR